jgi:hypothetical protein
MRTHDRKFVRALLCALMIVIASPLPVLAQTAAQAQAVPPGDPDAVLQTARELIKTGKYGHAIETLQALVAQLEPNTEIRRDAYLLLIKAFVYTGNGFKGTEDGQSNMKLNYGEARKLIAECLGIRELRHTRPEPETDYPEEMVAFFKDVRAQVFGAFRVTNVSPADAIVLFGADTLRTMAGETLLGGDDLAVGTHLVVVRAPGYRDLTAEVKISPGATVEQSFELTRHHGTLWYASRVGAALGVVGGLVAFLVKPSDGPTVDPPLGGPPPPPARAR